MLTEEEKYKLFADMVEYCPDTGEFTRKDGKEVKLHKEGYVMFYKYYNKKLLPLAGHRLAWFIHYGEIPDTILDHINRIRHDNRISNLRKACPITNARNASKCTTGKKGRKFSSKYKGVRKINKKNPWQARIRLEVGGLDHSLGCYPSEIEAARAYDQAAIKHFGEFACINGV